MLNLDRAFYWHKGMEEGNSQSLEGNVAVNLTIED